HRDVFEFADSAENVADLARFDLELMRVSDVLIRATAAAPKIGTGWFDTVRRFFSKIDNLRFGELFLLARDFRGDRFTLNRERDKNRFAIIARDTFSAESDVPHFEIARAHRQRSLPS